MEKIGRNEPCPCGSGKKYKKCCLEKQREETARKREEASAAEKALDWLAARYPDGVREAVDQDFYRGLNNGEKEKLNGLPPGYHELLSANLGEWLLTDARIRVGEENHPVRSLLLGAEGPDLKAEGARWLENVGKSALSLYEVHSVEPGVGMTLVDLVHPESPEIWVSEKVATQSLLPWDMLATRLVRNGGGSLLSGALYPFQRQAGRACLAKIARKVKKEERASDSSREIIGDIIRREWLKSLVTNAPSEALRDSEQEELPPITPGEAEHWANQPLNSLDGKTPMEAVKTAAGRRAVAELLKSAELRESRRIREEGGEPATLGFLWSRLGLDRERT